MKNARIQKWGNSQGLRVPKPLLEAAHFMVGEEVQLYAEAGRIVIEPVPKVLPAGKWQPGKGGGDIIEFSKRFKGRFKQKIDIKKALADHARARYAKSLK